MWLMSSKTVLVFNSLGSWVGTECSFCSGRVRAIDSPLAISWLSIVAAMAINRAIVILSPTHYPKKRKTVCLNDWKTMSFYHWWATLLEGRMAVPLKLLNSMNSLTSNNWGSWVGYNFCFFHVVCEYYNHYWLACQCARMSLNRSKNG